MDLVRCERSTAADRRETQQRRRRSMLCTNQRRGRSAEEALDSLRTGKMMVMC